MTEKVLLRRQPWSGGLTCRVPGPSHCKCGKGTNFQPDKHVEELVGFMMSVKALISIINGEHRRRTDTKREKKEQRGKGS